MSMEKKIIAKAFMEMAEGLESGSFGVKPRIALTGMGSEHGEENAMQAAVMAAARGVDVYYIGSLEHEGITTIHVADDEEGHKKMEEMVEKGEVDGAVTMHFPFPIGVSTVGRVITPAKGKEMFVANTTGTSSADRIEGMIKNAVYGIIAAKACGVKEPTLGILNVDARARPRWRSRSFKRTATTLSLQNPQERTAARSCEATTFCRALPT